MTYIDNLLDYLLSNPNDICGKCAWYIPHTVEEYKQAEENDKVLPYCRIKEEQGFRSDIDCREGMKAYFKKKEIRYNTGITEFLDVITDYCMEEENAVCEKKKSCFECIAAALFQAGYRNKTEVAAEVRRDTAATIVADITFLAAENDGNADIFDVIEMIVKKYGVTLQA